MEPGTGKVVIVTGLSGAGKTTALHTLEDLGYYCIDNLPTVLATDAVRACESGSVSRVALGIDVRVGAFLASAGKMLDDLRAGGKRDVLVLFFDASDEALLRRFSESRRPHPIRSDEPQEGDETSAASVLDGIRMERERLAPLRTGAAIFDTTHTSVHELRRNIIARLGPGSGGAPRMLTRLVSFGFKYGAPVDADLMFDVRFLENPYFVPALKLLPGTNAEVSAFVLGLEETKGLLGKVEDLLAFVLPRYEREGKSYLTVAVGCTGGRHRSVAIAEELARRLRATGAPIAISHRDMERASSRPGRLSFSEMQGVTTPRSFPPPSSNKPE